MRIVVGGSRFFSNKRMLYAALDALDQEFGITRVAHGACEGADSLADQWAQERGIERVPYHAEWGLYKRAAGPIRNGAMLRAERPDAVVTFPGGPGTGDLIRQARMLDLRIIKVEGA